MGFTTYRPSEFHRPERTPRGRGVVGFSQGILPYHPRNLCLSCIPTDCRSDISSLFSLSQHLKHDMLFDQRHEPLEPVRTHPLQQLLIFYPRFTRHLLALLHQSLAIQYKADSLSGNYRWSSWVARAAQQRKQPGQSTTPAWTTHSIALPCVKRGACPPLLPSWRRSRKAGVREVLRRALPGRCCNCHLETMRMPGCGPILCVLA